MFLCEAAHPLLEELREFGALTRGEALAAVPEPDQERLFGILTTMKSNLVKACNTPLDEKESQVG